MRPRDAAGRRLDSVSTHTHTHACAHYASTQTGHTRSFFAFHVGVLRCPHHKRAHSPCCIHSQNATHHLSHMVSRPVIQTPTQSSVKGLPNQRNAISHHVLCVFVHLFSVQTAMFPGAITRCLRLCRVSGCRPQATSGTQKNTWALSFCPVSVCCDPLRIVLLNFIVVYGHAFVA